MGFISALHWVLDKLVSPQLEAHVAKHSDNPGAARSDHRHLSEHLRILMHHQRTIHSVRSIVLTCLVLGPVYLINVLFPRNDKEAFAPFVFGVAVAMRVILFISCFGMLCLFRFCTRYIYNSVCVCV
jgi:hypothetical protein